MDLELSTAPNLPPSVRSALAIQTQLEIDDPEFRPLATVETVLHQLGKKFRIDAEHVRLLVEEHALIGFNIAVALDTKPTWRILTKSIDFFRATHGRKYHELADDPQQNWQKIFRLVVPHKKPIVTGLEIRRALLCDRGHVENLIINGRLTALQKSKPGPGGSWTVSRESFEKFLQGRMS